MSDKAEPSAWQRLEIAVRQALRDGYTSSYPQLPGQFRIPTTAKVEMEQAIAMIDAERKRG